MPLGGLLTVRRRQLDGTALELLVTRLAIFFCVFPELRPESVFFTLSDLIFCISAVLLLFIRGFRLAPLGPLTVPWIIAFATFGGGLTLSSLMGNEPDRVLIVLAQYAFAYVLLAYILVRTGESIVDSFVKMFVLGTVSANGIGLLVYFFGMNDQFFYVTGSGRLMSFMGNPNANANVIGLTLPFVLYLGFTRKWRLVYVLVSLAILGYALIATSSVGGLLWSSAGLTVFFLLTMSRRVLIGTLVCFTVAVPLLAEFGPAILPDTFQSRVLDAAEAGNLSQAGTFSDRMGLIREALDLVGERLVLGIGVDQYRVHSAWGAPVHNAYLLLWAEGGLITLIGWLMLPQIIALTALCVYGRPGGRLVAATVLAVVAVFLLAATGTAHMYARFWVVPLHLAMGLLMVAWARRGQPARAPSVQSHPDAATPPARGGPSPGRRLLPAGRLSAAASGPLARP